MSFSFGNDHTFAFGASSRTSSPKSSSPKHDQRIRMLESEIVTLKDEIAKTKSLLSELIQWKTNMKEQHSNQQDTIDTLRKRLGAIERKHAPELIEYNYEEIKSRIDPFRDELKMTHRVFARLIRLRYEVPLAIPICTKRVI